MAYSAILSLISGIKGQSDTQRAQERQSYSQGSGLAPSAQDALSAMARRQEASGVDVKEILDKAQAGTEQIEDPKQREEAQRALMQAQEAQRARVAEEEKQRQAQGGAGLGVRAIK